MQMLINSYPKYPLHRQMRMHKYISKYLSIYLIVYLIHSPRAGNFWSSSWVCWFGPSPSQLHSIRICSKGGQASRNPIGITKKIFHRFGVNNTASLSDRTKTNTQLSFETGSKHLTSTNPLHCARREPCKRFVRVHPGTRSWGDL